MLDALLFAVRDGIRAADMGYDDAARCDIMPDGQPPPRCGNIFVAVHEGPTRSTARRNLDERFSFSVTLTMRVAVPVDRVGDILLASKLARTANKGQPSFNARVDQLKNFLHMNWSITVSTSQTPASANDNLSAWAAPGVTTAYGFVEPAGFVSSEQPMLVGGEWFGANPEASDIGLKAELKFDGARRMQPQTAAVGPYV